ncbi:hypothetical protein D3C76_1303130 [compost metagenome]
MINIEIIHSYHIDKLPLDEQLMFYKDEFNSRHCELESCGHELCGFWVIYNGDLLCAECFEWKQEDDIQKANEEINRLQSEIDRVKKEYSL